LIKENLILFAFLSLLTSFSSFALQNRVSELEEPNSSPSVQAVNYLQPSIAISRRLYVKALLESVMGITEVEYGPYKITIVKSALSPTRKKQEMMRGDHINLIWSTEDANITKELIKVPFKTMKGVLGYRVFIIKADRQEEFSKIVNLEQLQRMKPGQGEFWTDTFIYRKNDFNVVTSHTMSALFLMLENSRFDFLPLGASEVNQEFLLKRLKHRSLAIEEDLLLKYALDMFFMISPSRPLLAERLEKGLLEIEKNGEFERIFKEFVQPEMDAINIKNRRVIHLKNL
jgi:hypothetical protein